MFLSFLIVFWRVGIILSLCGRQTTSEAQREFLWVLKRSGPLTLCCTTSKLRKCSPFQCARRATITPPPPPPPQSILVSLTHPPPHYSAVVNLFLVTCLKQRSLGRSFRICPPWCDQGGCKKTTDGGLQTEFFDSKNAFWACWYSSLDLGF